MFLSPKATPPLPPALGRRVCPRDSIVQSDLRPLGNEEVQRKPSKSKLFVNDGWNWACLSRSQRKTAELLDQEMSKVWQLKYGSVLLAETVLLTERCALWNRIPGEVRLVHRGQALWTCFYDSSWARHDGVPNIWILSCVVPYICRFPAGLGIVTTIQMKAWKTKQLNPSTFSSEHLCKTFINDSLSFKKSVILRMESH